jgi:hypothetical protein
LNKYFRINKLDTAERKTQSLSRARKSLNVVKRSWVRNGEAIATGFVELTVNQVVSKRFCKKQQMQWSKRGAHLLLQMRVKTLNRELGSVFKRWYPDMQVEGLAEAA